MAIEQEGKLRPGPDEERLSEAEALDWEITEADLGRAMAKWQRRVPGFFERIKQAALRQAQDGAAPPTPRRGEIGNSEVGDAEPER